MHVKIKLSKMDSARRQLEMAIELYFMDRDPVAIHTLAQAVYQLLVDLNKHHGGEPMITEAGSLKNYIIHGKEKEAANMFRQAENFFKHADRDPEAILDFNPLLNESSLWESCVKYAELTGEKTPPMKAMTIWFKVKNPNFFKFEPSEIDTLEQAKAFINNLGKASFYKEFLAYKMLYAGEHVGLEARFPTR